MLRYTGNTLMIDCGEDFVSEGNLEGRGHRHIVDLAVDFILIPFCQFGVNRA